MGDKGFHIPLRRDTAFLESKIGLCSQILCVLFPPIFLLNIGAAYLLPGLFVSVLLAWRMLRLRDMGWKDVGFRKPDNMMRLASTALIATAILLSFSHAVKRVIMAVAGAPPNLDAFKAVQGHAAVFAVALSVAWIFGAFLEELLFRGFLLTVFHELFSAKGRPPWMAWAGAVLATSILAGMGHFYQGVTGMATAGFIAAGFGVIYLMNRRNLWSSVLANGIYNTVAFTLVYAGIHPDL